MEKTRKQKRTQDDSKAFTVLNRVFLVFCIVVWIVLIPIVAVNGTLLVKSFLNPSEAPSVFGYTPLIIQDRSMKPALQDGDLILITPTDNSKLTAGEAGTGTIVAFKHGENIVIQRLVRIDTASNGDLIYITRADGRAAESKNETAVRQTEIVGELSSRIPGLGAFALFSQTQIGIICLLGVPLLLLVLYDVIFRRRKKMKEAIAAEKKKKLKAEEKKKEAQTDSEYQIPEIDDGSETEYQIPEVDDQLEFDYNIPEVEMSEPELEDEPVPEPRYQPPEPRYQPLEPRYQPQEPRYQPPEPRYQPQEPRYQPQEPRYQPQEPQYQPQEPQYQPPEPRYQQPGQGNRAMNPQKEQTPEQVAKMADDAMKKLDEALKMSDRKW